MWRALRFPNADGEIVPATMKVPSDKLLLPAMAQASDEGELDLDNTTPWPDQPSDEFLMYSMCYCLRKNKTAKWS